MRRSWIQWRCWFHTSAVTQYSLTISRSTVTLFGRRFTDKLWQSVFDNSMRQPWLYFCYWFYVSFLNSVTLSIPYGRCQSVVIDDFKVYSYSVFNGRFLHQQWHSVFENSMRRPWLYFCYRFNASVVNSLTLSIPCGSCHSVFIDDFQGLLLLCFGRRFMDQPCHSVFDNAMRRSWQYFCYRLDASVVNSLTLSIPYGSCHLVFFDDFKVYCYSVLAGDLWISRDITFLTIPRVGHDSIFAIDWMRRSWIHWRCRFHAEGVTQYSLMISRCTVTLFSLPIYGSEVT